MTRLARYVVALLFALTGLVILLVDVRYSHTAHLTNLLAALGCWFVAGLLINFADALAALNAVAGTVARFWGKGVQ